MLDPCCTTMKTMTLTREDLESDPDFSRPGEDLTDWKPLVEWMDHVGGFVIGHTAIFDCPWCGARLPEKFEEALAENRKSGVWIAVAPDGTVTATVKGEPADPDALMAKLRASTEDQD